MPRIHWSYQTPSSNNTGEDSIHEHHQMVNIKIRLIIFFAAKDGAALHSQQKQDQELTVAQIMDSLLLLVQQLAKGFLTLETFKMYYKMGFSKIQHQLWHGKTAGVRTENRFFVSHAARTGTLPHGIPALGGSQVRGFPHQVPLVMQRWSQAPKKCMAMHHKLPKTLMCNPMSHRG